MQRYSVTKIEFKTAYSSINDEPIQVPKCDVHEHEPDSEQGAQLFLRLTSNAERRRVADVSGTGKLMEETPLARWMNKLGF